MDSIQKDVDEWTGQFTPQYWPIYEMFARLTEEVGEVGREINHLYGNKKKKEGEKENSLGQELVDVLFSLVCIANSQGINLNDEWKKSMEKKHYGRDQNRYEKVEHKD